jgi:Flp pilus assembly protein TadD
VKLAVGILALLGVATFTFRSIATRPGDTTGVAGGAEDDVLVPETSLPEPSGTEPSTFRDAAEATRRGKDAFRAGNFETALGFFEELERLSPSNPTAHLYAGLCKQRLGDVAGAVASLRQAVDLQPTNKLGRKALIQLLVETGETEEAESLQAWLVERRPRDVESRVDLGRLYRRHGKLDLAIEELRRAAEMSRGRQEPLLELGVTLNEAGRTAEAIEIFQEVARNNPQDPGGHAGLGTALLREKRYQDALGPLEEAARLDPERANVRLNLAMTYESLDRIEDSLREYEAFVELAPNDPTASRVAKLVERARAALAERGAN